MEQSILEATDYVRNVSKKRLSITNILSRINKTSASKLDTRSLEKEFLQLIGKALIDSSYKIVNKVNLKLKLKPHRKIPIFRITMQNKFPLQGKAFLLIHHPVFAFPLNTYQ